MADNLGNNRESLHPSELQKDNVQERKSEQLSKEVQKTSEFVEGGLDVLDGVEAGNEQISENVSERKSGAPAAKAPRTSSAQATQAALKPIKVPTVEVMRNQVAKEIEKQIKVLEKEAKKIMHSSNQQFSPFALNGVLMKIRELKEILANLAFVTFETVKAWWMKFVKNISI